MRDRHILVVGGGAAGMTAAVWGARAGARVTILEHNDRVGKKLLSTGNGRCNFTNRIQKPDCYRCSQEEFPWQVINRFPAEKTIEFFRELGILPKERNGYMYPNSDQASSVLDVLRFELDALGVSVVTGCHIERLYKMGQKDSAPRGKSEAGAGRERKNKAGAGGEGRFVAETDKGRFYGDALIIAAGSKAAPQTGSDGSGYRLARSFGHHVITSLPALVQLRCEEKVYREVAGVRTEGRIRLYISEKKTGWHWQVAAEDTGEIQLTDYGISGIPVFQVSRYASAALHNHEQVKAVIDFLPHMTEQEAGAVLKERCERGTERSCEQLMTGLLNKKLCLMLLKRAKIDFRAKAGEISEEQWKALLVQLKAFETNVTAVNPYEQAQVCCGGVDTEEINPDTMESRKVPGLYFAGEILDVDGICGGYNLQWAWSSGAVAGMAAAKGLVAGNGKLRH